jgi:hypothetical protein
MPDLLLDVRHALRGFRKTPAFTLVAVISLALAIGANGFVFAVLNTAALRPFEVSDPPEPVSDPVWAADDGKQPDDVLPRLPGSSPAEHQLQRHDRGLAVLGSEARRA